mmetsp:Transcript_156914/g.273132  ORF Transcript_156914/g.273132 Transcript_156914/m.273132 type:complete len:228 (+) Transcript_156914:136-819(+)
MVNAQSVVSTNVVLGTIGSLAGFGFIVWAWDSFLDRHEHNPGRVRAAMLAALLLATVIELGVSFCAFTHPWVAFVALLVNSWGSLDAVLRFPAAHDIESFFSVKQFLLLLLKTFGYAFGLNGFRHHVGKFLLILMFDIWGMPVLYLMALPLNPADQVMPDERDDVDLVVRVWLLTVSRNERLRCLNSCRCWWYRRLVEASQSSSLAKFAICAASPTYRRAFHKARKV